MPAESRLLPTLYDLYRKNKVKVTREYVSIDKLYVDPLEQRNFSETAGKMMVKEFCPELCDDLVVIRKNGKMSIADGQHRAYALKALGYKKWWARVFEGKGRGADLGGTIFLLKNESRRSVSQLEKYHVALNAGVEQILPDGSRSHGWPQVNVTNQDEGSIGGNGVDEAVCQG